MWLREGCGGIFNSTGKLVTTSILVLPILIINCEIRSHSGSGKRGGICLLLEFTIRYHTVRSVLTVNNTNMKSVMFKLVSPLPNIIMLGDFNLPTMSWSQPGDCFISRIFCPFVESLFLQQFVNVPTRKKNILDLVFCNS